MTLQNGFIFRDINKCNPNIKFYELTLKTLPSLKCVDTTNFKFQNMHSSPQALFAQ